MLRAGSDQFYDRYLILVGGRRDGTRLNQAYRDLVATDELVDTVLPLFVQFRESGRVGESFGDFSNRIGIEALRAFAAAQRGVPAR